MSSPTGTIRTAVSNRIVALAADLDGFSASPAAGAWHVTRPPYGQLKNRRSLVIGVGTGSVEDDAIAAGHGPSVDDWLIGCYLQISDEPDFATAEQACEDGFNALADMLAAEPRLGMNPGPRDVRVSGDFETGSGQESGQPAYAFLTFTISASADILRNQP